MDVFKDRPVEPMTRLAESTPDSCRSDLLERYLDLYGCLVRSREIESEERKIIARGEGHFHIASAGHEATATLAEFLTPDDWLGCHYRDRALLLARGVEPRSFFDSLFANEASCSAGRHMNVMHSDRALNVMSMPVSVGNNLLPAVGVASRIKDDPGAPLVYCAIGDGGVQQGDFYEAVGEAVRANLPVLFLIQDNGYALSTTTGGQTFFSLPDGQAESFLGVPIHYWDGVDVIDSREQFGNLCSKIRSTRGPAIAVMRVERLGSHSNADDQQAYRNADTLAENAKFRDPLIEFRKQLLDLGVDNDQLLEIEESARVAVKSAADEARQSADPVLSLEVKAPLSADYVNQTEPKEGRRIDTNGIGVTMRAAMREALHQAMSKDEAVTLLGEDIEDPKGDVFGVTQGLSEAFPDRVRNAPLAEASIMGLTIGQALAGGKPVGFIQFADFLPLIQNLYHNELASMYWRSAGQWNCPVVIMVSCGGYRGGTGPFHTQTLESVLAHSPGVDIVMPSTARDAAGMVNAALASNRPTVILYPKNLINAKLRASSGDVANYWVPIGKAHQCRSGDDVTLVGWANTVPLCEEAAQQLEALGVSAEVIDLRSITPWDEDAIRSSVRKTKRLVVVHEDNGFCGVGAEICACVVEGESVPARVRRVTRPEALVPFNLANQLEILPSVDDIIEAAAELMDLQLGWASDDVESSNIETISAMGVGASDDSVTVVEWLVKEGDTVSVDQDIAIIEADKAAAEMVSPFEGVVEALAVDEGVSISVGDPIMRIRCAEANTTERSSTKNQKKKPYIISTDDAAPLLASGPRSDENTIVRLGAIGIAHGSVEVSNEELLKRFPEKTSDDIVRRTGIESRYWASPEQTPLSLAVEAVEQLLEKTPVAMEDIDLVICSTTTPDRGTPSLAMRVLHALAPEQCCPGYDISAGCSGYLYGLQCAYDFLEGRSGNVLLVTTEVLSRTLDLEDYDTAFLFGDAATATLISARSADSGEPELSDELRLHKPLISGIGESGESLNVPLTDSPDSTAMRGKRVFYDAVRHMTNAMTQACAASGLEMDDLDVIVPHQANQRISRALAKRLSGRPERVWENIRNFGNTSSSSIPLCLSKNWEDLPGNARVALVAFGGGFTFGAAVLDYVSEKAKPADTSE
ncbi:MAG: beta-ketoacyl-ACP synthase 3 [Verrucomicrobiota bacterium]